MKTNNKRIHEIIRVNQAGEFGAKRIYEGQLAVFPEDKTIKEMAKQEQKHLKKFNKLMVKNKVRPTALSPIWSIGGFFLGASTALMGRNAAMACTVAVEEVIEEHYSKQEKQLKKIGKKTELIKIIKKFKNDEIEHKKTALKNKAEETQGYTLLTLGIKNITKLAITISKKI